MAVAGLHNVSPFGPFFGDSQDPRPRTRESSLFRMWRELEHNHVVNNSHRSTRQISCSSSDGSSDSMSDEQRIDIGHGTSANSNENDNRGITCAETEQHDDSNSIISQQSTELGEHDRERVRHILQEWVNSGSINHSSDEFHINSSSNSQWLGENECETVRIIRECVQMNAQQRTNQEGGESGTQIEQVRDGLAITRTEIGGARKNLRRICGRQTLLDLLARAQCERKKELQGLLGKRPVSEFAHRNRIQALLRGRFLRNGRSIPDHRLSSVAATELGLLRERHTVSGLREGFLSKLGTAASGSVNSAESVTSSCDENNGGLESTDTGRAIMEIHTTSDSECSTYGNISRHEFLSQVTEIESPEEPVLDSERTEHDASINISTEMSFENDDINHGGPLQVCNERHELAPDDDHTTDLERNNNGEGDSRDEYTASSQERLSNNGEVGQDPMTESREEDYSNEAIDSLLDLPSGEVGASVGRVHTFYFPDDNARSMEVRELFERRHVSSLLRSGFREVLDQVLQSHVERQVYASGGSEFDDTSFSPDLAERETEQQNHGLASSLSEAADDENLFAPTSTFVNEYLPLWDFELQSVDMVNEGSNHQLGSEWEVVNELRNDMARLQQRLNIMQSMLEQCMDMQVELQRSVRQEVSAALNRSFLTRDSIKGNLLYDESTWDYVRRGICCVCRDGKIDSLLYRCGHMCTCSKCAERLVQGTGKCPMCQAPVVESVRAYFTQ